MNNQYADTAGLMLLAVTAFYVLDQVTDGMDLPPLIRTYLTIGLVIGVSYWWEQRRRYRR